MLPTTQFICKESEDVLGDIIVETKTDIDRVDNLIIIQNIDAFNEWSAFRGNLVTEIFNAFNANRVAQ